MIQCVVSVAMESDSDRITRLEKKVTLLTSLYKRYEEKYNAEVSKTALLKKIVTQSDKLIQVLQKTRRSSSSAAAAAAPATTADPAGSGPTPAKHTIYLVSATGQPGLAAFLENTFASFTNNRSPRFAQCVSVKFDRFAAATSGIKLPLGFWLQTIATLCLVGVLAILQLYFMVVIAAALRAHVMYRYWTALYECTGDKRFQVAIAKYRSEQFPNSTIGKILTNYVDLVISTFGKSAYSSMVTPEELVAPVTKVD